MNKFCKTCQTMTERDIQGKCKPCSRKRKAKWYADNPERVHEYSVKYYAENINKIRKSAIEYYSANREYILTLIAKRTAENIERVRSVKAKWSAENQDKRRIYEQNRRAIARKSGGRLSADIADRLFRLQRGRCACCGLPLGENYHLDHIMPIALGGANVDTNIQLLRSLCNMKKGSKHPINFMQERGLLL